MKSNILELSHFEEIAPSECREISGGFIVLTVVATLAAVCAISYYTGYGVGRLTNCGE